MKHHKKNKLLHKYMCVCVRDDFHSLVMGDTSNSHILSLAIITHNHTLSLPQISLCTFKNNEKTQDFCLYGQKTCS